MLNVVGYMTLYSQEKPLKNHYFRKEFLYDTFVYSVRTFARIRQHYFSKYWGDGYMGRPHHLKFWGYHSPSALLGIRPCVHCVMHKCIMLKVEGNEKHIK